MQQFSGRLGIIERVLTPFRVPVFDALASMCTDGLSVVAGQPAPGEALVSADTLHIAQLVHVRNKHLFKGRFYLCWQAGLIEWLEQWQPQALVIDANPRFLSSRSAMRWMRARDRPVFGWGLGVMLMSSGLESMRRRGRERYIRSFDGMFAYSSRAADQYHAMGVPRERIFVVKNAATFKPTTPLPNRPNHFPGRPLVLFVGKLSAAKRIENLVHACKALQNTFQPRLQIVGEGPELQKLQSLAKEVYPDTEFLGPRYGAKLNELFDSADLFVLPGMGGLAIQEAMSHGLPVIVAEADGTQDDLVRPDNGWNVPSGDIQAIVEAMQEAFSDVVKLRRRGAESYRIVAEEINIERMVEAFVRGLNSIKLDRR